MSFIASFFRQSNARKYSLVSDDEETLDGESSSFLSEKLKIYPKPPSTWHLVVPWVFSTVFFACLSIYFYRKTLMPPLGTFEKGWVTDFGKWPSCMHDRALLTMK